MIKKFQYVPKLVYILFIFTFLLLFFMFYSFGVDEDAVLNNYKALTVGDKRQSIDQLRTQVETANNALENDSSNGNWLNICLSTKQFLYDNKYSYSLTSYDRPMDANIIKATNCGDYVLYCLKKAGFFLDKDYTTAKGVAKYCKDAGWTINTDYSSIQDGDVVWMNRGYGHYTVDDLVNSTGESHIQICANAVEGLYYNVGGSSSIGVPATTQSTNISTRFICSFHVPIQ